MLNVAALDITNLDIICLFDGLNNRAGKTEDPEKISDMEAVKVKNFWVCPENEKDEHEGYEKYRIAILGESHGEEPTFHRLVPRMRADRLKKWKARLNVCFV